MTPSRLLRMKISPFGPSPKRRSARVDGVLPCATFFSLISCSSVFVCPLSLKRIRRIALLTAVRQLVGADVEHFTARVVAEDQQIRELRDLLPPVHDAHRNRRLRLQQRIELAVFDDGKRHLRIAARVFKADRLPADEAVAAFPLVPPEIRPLRHLAHLLDDVLPDIGDEEIAVTRIPREALRIAQADGVDLVERVGIVVVGEWIVFRECRTCRSRC